MLLANIIVCDSHAALLSGYIWCLSLNEVIKLLKVVASGDV